MIKYEVVMTMGERNWGVYGKNALESFDEYWPKDVHAYVYFDGKLPDEKYDRIHFIPYHDVIHEQESFKQRNKHRHPHTANLEVNDITYQAVKFSYKVYAQLYELEQARAEYIIYLDADVMTKAPVTHELLETISNENAYVSFLNRPGKYTETGFIIWNTNHPYHKEWCEQYRSMYDEDKIFEYDAWHDCIAFDACTLPKIQEGVIQGIDLSYGTGSKHPLVTGPLGAYFDHLKGPSRKATGFSPERKRAGF